MSSFKACLMSAATDASAEGNTRRREMLDKTIEQYERSVERFTKVQGLSRTHADQKAMMDVTAKLRRSTYEKKLNRINDLEKQLEFAQQVQSSKLSPYELIQKKLFQIQHAEDGMMTLLSGTSRDFINGFGLNWTGLKRKGTSAIDDVGSAIFSGKKSADPEVNKLAKAYMDMRQQVAQVARASGIPMPDPKENPLPQSWSADKMDAAHGGRDGWIEHHLAEGVLDWRRIALHDDVNPDVATNLEARRDFLDASYQSLTSRGFRSDGKPGNFSAAQTYAATRKIHYASYGAWKESQEKWGSGNLVDQIFSSLANDSAALAQINVMGTNPRGMLDTMRRVASEEVDKRASTIAKDKGDAAAGEYRKDQASKSGNIEAVYSEVMGLNSENVASGYLGKVISPVLRTVVPPIRLGGTVLKAIPSDFAMTAAHNIRNNREYSGLLRDYARTLTGLSREEVIAAGEDLSMSLGALKNVMRIGEEFDAPVAARAFANFGMRMNLLGPHTKIIREVNSVNFAVGTHRSKGKTFDQLPELERRIMENYGLTAKDWDVIRSLPSVTVGRREMLPATAIWRSDLPLKDKNRLYTAFSSFRHDVMELQVPTGSDEARVMLHGGTKAGTFAGEVRRHGSSFMNWPVSLYLRTVKTNLDTLYNTADRVKWLAGFTAALTVGGAIGLQLDNILNHGEVREMDPLKNPQFYVESVISGGSTHLLGDAAMASYATVTGKPYGGVEEMLGSMPGVGLAADAGFEATRAVRDAIDAESASAGLSILGGAALQGVTNLPPLNAGYSRMFTNHMLREELMEELDPGRARRNQKRLERRRQRRQGEDGSNSGGF